MGLSRRPHNVVAPLVNVRTLTSI